MEKRSIYYKNNISLKRPIMTFNTASFCFLTIDEAKLKNYNNFVRNVSICDRDEEE